MIRNRKLFSEDSVVNTLSIIIVGFVFLITVYPFYQSLIYSFNDGKDTMNGGVYLFPREFTLDNYKAVISDEALVLSFFVTVLRTVVGTASALFFTAMVAYGLSKPYLMFRKFYSVLALITMYFSGGLIPSYLLLRNLGLLNSFWVYIIPGLFSYFNALLLMAFYRELPSGLEEAAKLDGAGDFYIFLKIILPLSKPVLATVSLFLAVGHWNDWFTSAYYINDMDLWTMPTILMRVLSDAEGMSKITEMAGANMGALQGETTITLDSIRHATMIVTILPIVCVYPFLQKYFVKGMMVGAIKA